MEYDIVRVLRRTVQEQRGASGDEVRGYQGDGFVYRPSPYFRPGVFGLKFGPTPEG